MSVLESEVRVNDAAREVAAPRGFFRFAGALSIVLGFLAILLPLAATLAVEVVLGVVLAASGVLACVSAVQAPGASRKAGEMLLGLLGVTAGLLLLAAPTSGLIALTLLLGAYFLASGALKLYLASQAGRDGSPGWLVAGGVVSILLGLLIWSGLPGTAAWALGLIVGVDLVFYGVGLLAVASAARRRDREAVEVESPRAAA